MGPGPAAGQGGGQRPSQQESGRVSVTRVRFQDPQPEDPIFTGLRMSKVENEFRRRVEEYTSDSEDEENKMSTIKRNGAIVSDHAEEKSEDKSNDSRRKFSDPTSPPPL